MQERPKVSATHRCSPSWGVTVGHMRSDSFTTAVAQAKLSRSSYDSCAARSRLGMHGEVLGPRQVFTLWQAVGGQAQASDVGHRAPWACQRSLRRTRLRLTHPKPSISASSRASMSEFDAMAYTACASVIAVVS